MTLDLYAAIFAVKAINNTRVDNLALTFIVKVKCMGQYVKSWNKRASSLKIP